MFPQTWWIRYPHTIRVGHMVIFSSKPQKCVPVISCEKNQNSGDQTERKNHRERETHTTEEGEWKSHIPDWFLKYVRLCNPSDKRVSAEEKQEGLNRAVNILYDTFLRSQMQKNNGSVSNNSKLEVFTLCCVISCILFLPLDVIHCLFRMSGTLLFFLTFSYVRL